MTRILVISDSYPDDMSSGAHIRVRNLVAELAKRNDAFLVILGDLPVGAKPEIDLNVVDTKTFPDIPRHKRSVARHFRIGNARILRRAYPSYLRGLRHEIRSLMNEWNIELIVCMAPITAELVMPEAVPKLLDYCDSRTLTDRRMLGNRGRSLSLRQRLTKLVGYFRQRLRERALVRQFDMTTTISEADRRCLVEVAGVHPDTVKVIPNGVSPDALRSRGEPLTRKRSIIFWGNLDFPPNWTALEFFYEQVFLPYLAEHDISLHIIGKGAVESIVRMGEHPLVHLHGYVDDLYKEIRSHGVMINPMVEGSGLKNKVLESFACRVPVVSTTIGIEAVGAESGTHFLLADSPEQFSKAVLKLVNDQAFSATVVGVARQFVEDNFDWSKIGNRFGELVDGLVESAGSNRNAR